MKTIFLLLMLFPLFAGAQESSEEPFALPDGEWVFFAVEERDGAKYRIFYLLTADGEKVPIWSLRKTEEHHWSDSLTTIFAADRKGDDLALLVNQADHLSLEFMRLNLATGVLRRSSFSRSVFTRGVGSPRQYSVTAPDTITVGDGKKTRVIEWKPDGKAYVDNEVIGVSTPRDEVFGIKIASASAVPGPATPDGPLAAASNSTVATSPPRVLLRPSSRGQQPSDSDASGWLVALGLLILLGGALLVWRMKSQA